MFTYEDSCHVAGLVPFGLAGHVIGDPYTVDNEIVERDIAYLAILVVAGDDRHLLAGAIVCYILEEDIVDTCAGGGAVFLVEEYAYVEQLPLAEILDTYVVEGYVAHHIVVAAAYAEASLIVDLLFGMVEYVDVAVGYVAYGVGRSVGPYLFRASVKS